MASRLLIIRNPESPLLGYLDLEKDSQKIILAGKAAESENLKNKNNVKILPPDAGDADYDAMLDAVFAADSVICV